MESKEMNLGLFDPGMTELHRVGLAGLYITLNNLQEQNNLPKGITWKLENNRLLITFQPEKGKLDKVFQDLFARSFGTTKNGIIDFASHHRAGLGDIQRLQIHDAIMTSFLQHGRTRKTEKETKKLSFQIDDKQIIKEIKPLLSYQHQTACERLFNSKKELENEVDLAGWAFPGGGVRHEAHHHETSLTEPVQRFLCLLYTPTACLYYRLSHKKSDNKADKKRNTAVVLPHITNIKKYSFSFINYLKSPIQNLWADGLGDAGLTALVTLKAQDNLDKLGITGCTVITMGTVGWSSQQKTRTFVLSIDNIEVIRLDDFEIVLRSLPNVPVINKPKETKKKKNTDPEEYFFVSTKLSRGLIADNIASNRDWFHNFSSLMTSKNTANSVYNYEKGGLNDMIHQIQWEHDADKKFVEAVHDAIRSRYGQIAEKARQKSEKIPFDREFERIRTGLMRAKNQQTLRTELADLFARGGRNKVLQNEWKNLLPIFNGKDWQKARDLALFSLASYKGKGHEESVETPDEIEIIE